jgi:uncharacterized protein (UPF0332 family)
MAEARERLQLAAMALAAGSPGGAISLAYYAMLYAARAALSEEDRYAKTHSGTWLLFKETFVEPGRFEKDLFDKTQKTLPLRLGVDYDALPVGHGEAEAVVERAGLFLSAIEALYPD